MIEVQPSWSWFCRRQRGESWFALTRGQSAGFAQQRMQKRLASGSCGSISISASREEPHDLLDAGRSQQATERSGSALGSVARADRVGRVAAAAVTAKGVVCGMSARNPRSINAHWPPPSLGCRRSNLRGSMQAVIWTSARSARDLKHARTCICPCRCPSCTRPSSRRPKGADPAQRRAWCWCVRSRIRTQAHQYESSPEPFEVSLSPMDVCLF